MEKAGFLDSVIEKILSYSGIHVVETQKPILQAHIQKKAAAKKVSAEDFCARLEPETEEFNEIINLITINETYFFREEKQFDFLKEEVFPKYRGKSLTLWSCCCATGEEPISLLALALSMGVNLTVYASDIDTKALESLRRGRYSLYSLRTDGKKYHELLEPYSTQTESEIIFKRDFLSHIHEFKYNLVQDTQLPFLDDVDIIFMRNVFIYFDKQTRIDVTKKVTERLKKEGMLFFSMNEVGAIDDRIIPPTLYKTNSGTVYYFKKGKNADVRGVAAGSTQGAKAFAGAGSQKGASVKGGLREGTAQGRARGSEKGAAVTQGRLKEGSSPAATRPIGTTSSSARPAGTTSAPSARRVESDAPSKQSAAKSSKELKKLYEQICSEINGGNFENARSIAKAVDGEGNKRYSFFMQGYIEYHADNRSSAEMLFAYAETMAQDFWPAFFYHGMVLRDMGKKEKADYCFKRCQELLQGFGSNNPYDFALDSFSPSYFYSLCETFRGGE